MKAKPSFAITFGIFAAVWFLLFPETLRAGTVGQPCDQPRIFEGAAVNVVVLPYETSLPERMGTNALGEQLSLLIQMQVLFEILEYKSVGVIQLVPSQEQNAPRCNPEEVWYHIHSGKQVSGIVMVWGRIFQDEEQVYVQSFARFAIKDTPEKFVLNAGGSKYEGVLSAQQVAFPSRQVSVADLEQIAANYQKFGTIRNSKNENEQGEPLSHGIGRCVGCEGTRLDSGPRYSYVVDQPEGEWVHIRTLEGDTGGWLKLGAPLGDRPLDVFLPELNLIKATVGYMEARQEKIKSNPASAEQLVSRYHELAGPGPAEAEVVGWELAGLEWLGSKPGSKGRLSKAQAAFDRALALDPSDADARNLAAMTTVYAAFIDKRPLSESKTADEFLSATVVDKKQGPALANLRTFYEQLEGFSAGSPKPDFELKDTLSSKYVKGQLNKLSKME